MLHARFIPYSLQFRRPAGTSRGVLLDKPSWFILIHHRQQPEVVGVGECSIIPGLSIESVADLEAEIDSLCRNITDFDAWNAKSGEKFPALAFAVETALLDLEKGGKRILFDNDFSLGKSGIEINGLIWMGDKQYMRQQIIQKIEAGFKVIKLKVGALNFDDELALLKYIRNEFKEKDLTIRLDANGAFGAADALEKLNRLSEFQIHSIEQPIMAGQHELMHQLCQQSQIPIALDEELIGVFGIKNQKALLENISPAYIILKPSLLGGFRQSDQWIELAESMHIDWWATSALESNIGLNAIAQWTASKKVTLPQGLGTGQLYENNIDSPLFIEGDKLVHDNEQKWDLKLLGI